MRKKPIKHFNVINYDCNRKKFISYDIIPYLVNVYKKLEEKPKTYKELQSFIEKESMYQFWSRCEYEIILMDWPCQKESEKWDIYDQIKMNLDTITNVLIDNIK